MTTTLEALLLRHVEAGAVPGAVALLGRGDDVQVAAVGSAAVDGPPLRTDAIVRIQSMTKAVTSVAALRLVESGRLRLDDSVQTWLPELADRRVLASPLAPLDDTVPARRPITVRHLLTSSSGYGMALTPSPLQRAMADNGTEAGPQPVGLGADEWLARLAELPLAVHPGEGWRYHHSFGLLGILMARLTGRPLGEHLTEDLLAPLGMVDTGYWVPPDRLDRLPAAYRHDGEGLVEIEPAGGGFHAGPPPFDVSHAELVSTAADYHRFARLLAGGGRMDDTVLLSPHLVREMTTDQVPAASKTPESFFPGFWEATGWGFGIGVQTGGEHAGRYGWSGGLGTHFFVDPDGTVAILLTQVEMGPRMEPLLAEFEALDAEGERRS